MNKGSDSTGRVILHQSEREIEAQRGYVEVIVFFFFFYDAACLVDSSFYCKVFLLFWSSLIVFESVKSNVEWHSIPSV